MQNCVMASRCEHSGQDWTGLSMLNDDDHLNNTNFSSIRSVNCVICAIYTQICCEPYYCFLIWFNEFSLFAYLSFFNQEFRVVLFSLNKIFVVIDVWCSPHRCKSLQVNHQAPPPAGGPPDPAAGRPAASTL